MMCKVQEHKTRFEVKFLGTYYIAPISSIIPRLQSARAAELHTLSEETAKHCD